MHDEPLWLEPDYFEDFRCKCGECRSCCCDGWDIAVSQEEYFRLIGMECSDELHHRLECAFRVPEKPAPERFRLISSNWLGECPMRDSDGLCMLQKECGEEALPEVCRVYPRSLRCENGQNQACCSSSCEAVIEILMEEEKLQLQFAHLNLQAEYSETKKMDIQKFGKKGLEIMQDRSKFLGMRVRDVRALLCGRRPLFAAGWACCRHTPCARVLSDMPKGCRGTGCGRAGPPGRRSPHRGRAGPPGRGSPYRGRAGPPRRGSP